MSSNFCSQCGNPANPGDMYCRNCGAPLTRSYQQQDSQQEYQRQDSRQEYQQQNEQAYQQQPYSSQVIFDDAFNNDVSDKSWLIALLLCLFLGGLGIHRFYLGYNARGVTYIVLLILGIALTLVFVGVVFYIIVVIMVLVDLIKILLRKLPDADGRPLQ